MPNSIIENSIAIGSALPAVAGGSLVHMFTPIPQRPTPSPIGPALIGRSTRVITTRPQLAISDQELHARIQWANRTSQHFAISYDRTAFADVQVSTLLESLEDGYSRIFSLTHESFPDRLKIFLIDQRTTSLLGRAVRSHLDREERAMYLVESSSHSAASDVLRLLTHAMRLTRCAKHYEHTPGWAYLEEAFSVFLSARLGTQDDVFPFYGAEADVIAHHLCCGEVKHRLLDLWNNVERPVTLEETVLNGAFFLYLGDTHSDDLVVTFSKVDDPVTSSTFRDFFGRSLEKLEAQWNEYLPISSIALTRLEKDAMIERWERAIEPSRGNRT